MRPLAIAYGNSCQAKKWMNKTISYDDLKERLRVPQRTTETAEEYAKCRSHSVMRQKTTAALSAVC